MKYKTIIGLEIHIELNTRSKMFSAAPNDPFHQEANACVTPICIGMPGTLPVPNREAIVKTLRLGLALQCDIPQESKFDRKHYFYPDLPKGYQISQYDQPFCKGGELTVDDQTVRLIRIHLEEDAGKLLHSPDKNYSEVDLNRAGVPLMEIVTEPDLTSGAQARSFLKELQLIARTLDISEAEMEKGQLRCDANVNVAFEADGKEIKTYISEIKNLNSFRMVERAVSFEAERLYQEWQDDTEARKRKGKITVGWNDLTGETLLQRTKEEAADYRYFPEPDIPPLRIYDADNNDPAPDENSFDLAEIRQTVKELPGGRRERYGSSGLSPSDIETIVRQPWKRALLDELLAAKVNEKNMDEKVIKQAATQLIHDAVEGITVNHLLDSARMRLAGEISSNIPKLAFAVLAKNPTKDLTSEPEKDLAKLVEERGWRQTSDDSALRPAVDEVIAANPAVVAEYRQGKQQVIGFLIGQVMSKTKGSADPNKVRELLESALTDEQPTG